MNLTKEIKNIKINGDQIDKVIKGVKDMGQSERKNLALGLPVSETSHIEDGGGKFFSSHTTDGDREWTRWISTHGDTAPKLEIILKQVSEVDEIRVYSGNNRGTISFIKEINIFVDDRLIVSDKDVNKYESIYKISESGKKFTFTFPPGVNRIYQLEIYGTYRLIKENILWKRWSLYDDS